jgi:hypothetical protein
MKSCLLPFPNSRLEIFAKKIYFRNEMIMKISLREDNISPNTSAIERLHIIEILINHVRIKLDGDVEKNHPKDSDYTWI